MRKLNNCPPEFYSNCANAQLKCRDCVAGFGKKALYYEPYLNLDRVHPSSDWQQDKQKKRKILKQSQDTESRIAKAIARKTLASGAANHDGDLVAADDIRIEVKRRGARKSWNVTVQEYDKGLKQGIDVFAIEIERDDTGVRETLYCCTEDFFASVVAGKLDEKTTNQE
jgi:hypothetical protein